jgi:hypothetical protein
MTRVLGVGLIGMILVGQSRAVYSTYRTDTSRALGTLGSPDLPSVTGSCQYGDFLFANRWGPVPCPFLRLNEAFYNEL